MSTRDDVPDLLLPADVRPHLRSDGWGELTGGGATGSTNVEAVKLARAGSPSGTVVLASEQTAGRGRLGREWVSPRGGVYVSAIVRPAAVPADLTGLPLAIAYGVAMEVAERFALERPIMVKWPNDLRLPGESGVRGAPAGGKLGGLLLEIAGEADRTEWVVAGVGLNVRRLDPPVDGAVSLAETMGPDRAPPSLAEVAAAVLDGIWRGYRLLLDEGFETVRSAFDPLDALRGAPVTVSDIDGRLRAEGVADGIDAAGRLLVRTGPGSEDVVVVTSGDVTLARSASDRDGGVS